MVGNIAIRAQVAANKKVDKKVEALTCQMLPVACYLKSSKIFATNKTGLLYSLIGNK